MPPRSKPTPAIVLRTQSLAAAIDAWSKCDPGSPQAAEYMEMAEFWYRSLDPFLNRGAVVAADSSTSQVSSKGK